MGERIVSLHLSLFLEFNLGYFVKGWEEHIADNWGVIPCQSRYITFVISDIMKFTILGPPVCFEMLYTIKLKGYIQYTGEQAAVLRMYRGHLEQNFFH